MPDIKQQKPIPIRNLNPDIYHQARMAALKARENIGAWITKAIKERLAREKGG